MAHYKYVIDLDERGEFQAHVEDHDGQTVFEFKYPEYYRDDETGEEIENSTIFDIGFMKDTKDVEGLEKYLKHNGVMPQEAELKMSDDEEDEDEEEDEFAQGGYNPAQEILDSIYAYAGKTYRIVADIGDGKVGMTAYYTKDVIDDVAKEITDKGYEIINIEEKDDSYMEGGEIKEYQGTKYYTVNFKTYRNFPAAYRLTFYWGNTKPFVEVTKVTNNPFGGRIGKDFDTLDKAIAYYKSPELKVLLLQAGDVAKKAGVPMDMFAMGGMFAEGGDTAKATLLLIDSANPLSSQVQKITGDTLNTGDYKDVGVGNFNILTHKKSGKVFIVYPKRIYNQLPKEEKQDDLDYLKRVEKISFADGGNMAKGGVIGSSPTKDGIEKLIGRYYFSSNISLHKVGDKDEYDVHNAKGKVNGVKVIEKKGRFQFVQEEKKKMGGKTKNFKDMTFKEKSATIQAKLRGSKVSPKYQKMYGKTYDNKEAKQAADAITGKIVSKMKQ